MTKKKKGGSMNSIAAECKDDISYLRETMAVIAHRIEEMHSNLHGNGQKGFIEETKDKINELKENQQKQKWMTILGFTVITAGGGVSGGLFFNMLRHIFQLTGR